jgi:hypothetical protein
VNRVPRSHRRPAARAGLVLACLALFLVAQAAALAHTHGAEASCEACACEHVHEAPTGDDPAAPHDDEGPDGCALCRVLGSVPVPLSLPAPLPLPIVVRETPRAAPVDPAPAPVVRESLARGPPTAARVDTPRAGRRTL